MKTTIDKIYEFITRLIVLLEDELNNTNNKKTIATHKNVADILNKLVHLILRLNKIDCTKYSQDDSSLTESDELLIKHFIKKITDDIKSKSEI